jgi:hypothetical protein
LFIQIETPFFGFDGSISQSENHISVSNGTINLKGRRAKMKNRKNSTFVLVFLLCIGFFGSISVNTANSFSYDFEIIETLQIPAPHAAAPIMYIGDMDNDDILDIVFVTVNGTSRTFTIIEADNGTFWTRFSYTQVHHRTSIVAEVDGDSTPEILISRLYPNSLKIFEAAGNDNYVLRHSDGSLGQIEHLRVGDSDANGRKEFLIGAERKGLHIYESVSDNVYVNQRTLPGSYPSNLNIGIPGVYDLDGDGNPETVFCDDPYQPNNPKLYVYDHNYNQVYFNAVSHLQPYSFGDTDGNGLGEIIGYTLTYYYQPINFLILESTGTNNSYTEVFRDAYYTGYPYSPSGVFDVDGDGQLEFWRRIDGGSGQLDIFAFAHRDGATIADFYNSGTLLQGYTGDIRGFRVLGDTNGNGFVELAVIQGTQIHFLAAADADDDGVPDVADNAQNEYNPDQSDIDGDLVGDVADPCPNDPSDTCDPNGSAAESVGSAGGHISTPDESVEIDIPAGALAEQTSISITESGSNFILGTNLGLGRAVFGVDIGPDGTSFSDAISIIFSWADVDNNGRVDDMGIRESRLRISKDGVVIAGPCSEDSGCDMAENTFTVSVTELSQFALVFIDDEGPIVESVTAIPNPAVVGEEVTLNAVIDDTETGESDIESAEYSFDGQEWFLLTEANGVYSVSFFTPATPGVYTLYVQGTDEYENKGEQAEVLLVCYDPDGGFVTGGGWIWSPAGAYQPDPELDGKAHFGFVSKYKKGATIPTGQTEFKFKAGSLNFHSTSYDWLVIAGAKAKYKGVGTINNSGNYGFMISAIDAALTSSTDVDLFRIKIWDKDNGDAIVYDNQMGADEDADPATAIGGGSIVIHKSKSK